MKIEFSAPLLSPVLAGGILLCSAVLAACSAGMTGVVVDAAPRRAGEVREIPRGGKAADAGPRNESPVVSGVVPPEGEAFDIVLVELRVSDSSDDVVSVRVEYDVLGDEPDRGWELARAVQDDATRRFGLRGIRAVHAGTALAFFWDTAVDLPDREACVRLRFTATDGKAESVPVESAPFHLDNR